MTFSDQLRTIYRQTRQYAQSGDISGAIAGCRELAGLCSTQYELDNGDKIKTKAQLKYHSNNFAAYAGILEREGINSKIQEFFGISASMAIPPIPPLTDIQADNGGEVVKKTVSHCSIDPIDDLGRIPRKGENQKPQYKAQFSNGLTPGENITFSTGVKAISGSDGSYSAQRIGEAAFEPEKLGEFVGQQEIVKRILAEIEASKKRGIKHIDHVMLFGNRGLGKTTLMRLIANELGVPFHHLDCTQFCNDVASHRAFQNFFKMIGSENVPVVIGLDEFHDLPKKLQSGLLTLLNDRKLVYMDNSGINHSIAIDDFTFIGATTNAQDVLPTIKDRCSNLTFFLKDYSRDDLRLIFLRKFTSKNLEISDDALTECINRCRGSIREVNSIVHGIETLAINTGTSLISVSVAAEHFSNAEIDPAGLKSKDLEIINAIYHDASETMAEDTLSARVGIDPKTYRSEYEPYLIKSGFINVTGRGRSLTEKAIAYQTGIEKSSTAAGEPETDAQEDQQADHIESVEGYGEDTIPDFIDELVLDDSESR